MVHYCDHCKKITQCHIDSPKLYGIAMPHRVCNICGYSVEFSKEPVDGQC